MTTGVSCYADDGEFDEVWIWAECVGCGGGVQVPESQFFDWDIYCDYCAW